MTGEHVLTLMRWLLRWLEQVCLEKEVDSKFDCTPLGTPNSKSNILLMGTLMKETSNWTWIQVKSSTSLINIKNSFLLTACSLKDSLKGCSLEPFSQKSCMPMIQIESGSDSIMIFSWFKQSATSSFGASGIVAASRRSPRFRHTNAWITFVSKTYDEYLWHTFWQTGNETAHQRAHQLQPCWETKPNLWLASSCHHMGWQPFWITWSWTVGGTRVLSLGNYLLNFVFFQT